MFLDKGQISFVSADHNTAELSYACAGSRLLIYEHNSFIMFKGDSKHIGDSPQPGFKGYITHYTKLTEN